MGKGEGQGRWPVLMAADLPRGILPNVFYDFHMITEQGSLSLCPCRPSLGHPLLPDSTICRGLPSSLQWP